MCIIAPTAGLERYSTLSTAQMCLYHVNDPRYWEFYRKRNKQGDLVFLDCGAYEGVDFDINKYIERIDDLQPSVVVLPDLLLCDWKRSYGYSLGMMEYIVRKISPDTAYAFMFVPQAKEGDTKGFMDCLEQALTVGFPWIGIPRAVVTYIFKNEYARLVIADFLRNKSPNTKVHALGYGGNVHELYFLDKLGVKTWDSSAPVWRGWLGRRMSDFWGDFPLDFSAKYEPHQFMNGLVEHPNHYDILSNLEACGVDTSPTRTTD